MTAYSRPVVSQLIAIKIRSSRGRHEEILPFQFRTNELTRALKRAESAYLRAHRDAKKLDAFVRLNAVFREEHSFFRKCERLLHDWDSLSRVAKRDIAEAANYQASVRRYGDDETLLATRHRPNPDLMIEEFRRSLMPIRDASLANSRTRFVMTSSKGKDRLGQKNYSPLRAFSHELKCVWDKALEREFGTEFNKKFAFSVAGTFVFKAIRVLTSEYSELEVRRIIRSLQSKSYDPEQFRESIPSNNSLQMLAPQLASSLID